MIQQISGGVNRYFRVTPVYAAMVLALSAFGTDMAQAAGCGTFTADVGFIDCTTVSGAVTVTVGGSTAMTVGPSAGKDSIKTGSYNGHNSTVNVIGNTSIIANGTNLGINLVLDAATDTGDTTLHFSGAYNSVTTKNANLTLSNNKGKGSAYIIVDAGSDLTLTSTPTSNPTMTSNAWDGLEVDSGTGPGAFASIKHSGTGTITLSGGNAVLVNARRNANSNGEAIIASGVTLNVKNTDSGNANLSNSGIRLLTTNGTGTVNSGATINTEGAQADGIYAEANGTGNLDITNSGKITTGVDGAVGDYSSGMNIGSLAGAITITNTSSGEIKTYGTNGDGINVAGNAAGNNTQLTNNGEIETYGLDSKGINAHIKDNDIIITNNGSITTNSDGNADAISIFTTPTATGSVVITNNGLIKTSGNNNGQGNVENAPAGIEAHLVYGDVNITNNGNITGTGLIADAVSTHTSGNTTITNTATGQIHGGSGIANAVRLAGVVQTLTNAGTIDALSDEAILADAVSMPTSTISINNSGTITGSYWEFGSPVSVDNSGTWNLRRFTDTDGDGVRDTLAVLRSNFGSISDSTISNSTFTNRGTIALLGDGGQATALNNNGEFATGYAANTMAIGGAVQGQLLNLKTFINSGTIDLGPANAAVGDVLVITGGITPGVSSGGVYVADGGRLILDTVLNEGGANSQSDMLIVDGTQLGSAATAIQIVNVGGAGALTVGNGIELVRVLDSSRSADGVFRLGGRVVAGAYEYDLYHGGVGADADNGNWYLRSIADPNPTINSNQDANGRGTPRTETGVYLRNLAAASNMFIHTLHDRLGEPQFTDGYKADSNAKVSSLWIRVAGNHTDGNAAGGQVDLSTDTTLVHLGGDLARWSSSGNDRWLFGLMGAYGESDTDASAAHHPITPSGYQRTASGKVTGYGLGGYLTWYGNRDKPNGPYVDLWGMYGWYSNKVKGNLLAEEKYDSNGWTASVEAGYAFVARDSENRQWMIEPQAQVAYGNYDEENHREQNGTWVTGGNYDGVVTRLGARVYSRSKQGNGLQPFVEVNWWHGNAQNSLRFNDVLVDDGTPDNTYELKAGLQGEIARHWQLWGHVAGRWGESGYRSYEGMVGAKFQF